MPSKDVSQNMCSCLNHPLQERISEMHVSDNQVRQWLLSSGLEESERWF